MMFIIIDFHPLGANSLRQRRCVISARVAWVDKVECEMRMVKAVMMTMVTMIPSYCPNNPEKGQSNFGNDSLAS